MQVLLAAVALLALMALAARIVNQESLVESGLAPSRQLDLLLIKPTTGTARSIGTSVLTHPSKADDIQDLQPSRDRLGGDQFSLSFRMKLVDLETPTDRCILLWGDPNYVKFKPQDSGAPIEHLLVFMPMIWLSTEPSENPNGMPRHKITVFFNGTGSILNQCTGDVESEPATFDLQRTGAVITVTFMDYYVNATSRGCICSVYVNSRLAASAQVEESSIRRNSGIMYVLPDPSVLGGISTLVKPRNPSNVRLSELSYHNYELSLSDIMRKIRGNFVYTTQTSLDAESSPSGVYDATRDLSYHNLVTPIYA